MWLMPRRSAASVVVRGALKLEWPFKDILNGGKGPCLLHHLCITPSPAATWKALCHPITGCHMEGVSLGAAAPCGRGNAQ